jgi:hypothetical protein
MLTRTRIRRLPWKGNAAEDILGGTLDRANEILARELDDDEAWKAEKLIHKLCFGEIIGDEQRGAWQALRRQWEKPNGAAG